MDNLVSGIYILKFTGTNKVYVGQSVNINARFLKHTSSFTLGRASKKLQTAYNKYGLPTLEIVLECDISCLDQEETNFIKKYDSLDNGYNTAREGAVPVFDGLAHHGSKYTIADYFCTLYYLGIPGYSWKQIAEITGVSQYVISHISAGESHAWLKEAFPTEYASLLKIRLHGGRRGAYMQGIRYPKLVSPEGVEHEVTHVTNFAKEHNLLQPKVTELLKGTRNVHKGWTRKTET